MSVFNRGQTEQPLPASVHQIAGDLGDAASYARLGEQRFDVVCQFVAFDMQRVEKDLQIFSGRAGQYVFISTASVHAKPIDRFERITERTPQQDPFWEYSPEEDADGAAHPARPELTRSASREPAHSVKTNGPVAE